MKHLPTPRSSRARRAAVVGLASLASVASVALGGLSAGTAHADTPLPSTETLGAALVGVVDPTQYLPLTGASAYAAPATTPLRVVDVSTSAALTAALADAQPGDNIVIASGTYTGPFTASRSGTLAHPVVVRPATGAAVVLTAHLSTPSCATKGPDPDRTFSFVGGVGHWVLQGLTVDGGITISSKNANAVQDWQAKAINDRNWSVRRAVPGTSTRDVNASRAQDSYLGNLLGTTLYPSQDLQLLGNTITRKGVFGRLTSFNVISGNRIQDILCGTGPGLWLANYSHGNVVSGNFVTRVAASTAIHFMQEGIRLGNGSDYNVVVGNRVRDLPVGGRGITTDQDSSWNLFTQNRVSTVDIAFNDQQSGWGNTWSYNVALHPRVAAFSFRMEDVGLATPSPDTSTFNPVVRCNTTLGSPIDFQAGALSGATIESNQFTSWKFNKPLMGYWTAQHNTWNGSTSAPSISSPVTMTGC